MWSAVASPFGQTCQVPCLTIAMASLAGSRCNGAIAPKRTRRSTVSVRAVASPEVKVAGSSAAPAPWAPTSWRNFPVVQQPEYPDQEAFKKTLKQISSFPPLIFGGACNWHGSLLCPCRRARLHADGMALGVGSDSWMTCA